MWCWIASLVLVLESINIRGRGRGRRTRSKPSSIAAHYTSVGNADSLAYYLEAKYKFTPQLFGAVRWNQHVFGTLPDGAGGEDKWGGDIWRTDFALGYRFTAHTELKLPYSLERRSADSAGFANTFAAQFTIRF